MKIYCIEIERGGIGEEDLTLHHGFEKEPTKQEVLDYIMSQDIGFDEEYCEFNFYHVADEAKGKTALIPTLQLTPFEQTKENLIALASDYKNMVVTKDNMKEANEARLVLYRKRIEIQNVATANRKTIKEFLKNNNDATEEELIGTIEPTELALEAKIKTVKDAIAEEERIENERVLKLRAVLDNLRDETIKATNSNDTAYLKTMIEATVIIDLQELTEVGESLLLTLKETAKNRLELLEFQAKKKADEEAELARIAAEEKVKKEAEEKVLDIDAVNDNLLAHRTYSETLLANTANNIDSAILEGISGAPFDEPIEAPKLSPMKTVPIGACSENPLVATNIPLPTDKELLIRMATSFSNVLLPICEEKQGIQHVEYVKNMLSKLSEQTLKVAEKL